MTLVEANECFEAWSYAPPVSLLVEAVVMGFGGSKPSKGPKDKLAYAMATGGAISNPTDGDLAKLASEAGPALPILRGLDKGLPKTPPVFDIEEMRTKIRQRKVDAALRGRSIG